MKTNESNKFLNEINDRYGKYIWKVARRYAIGIWSPEDLFQHLVTLLLDMPKSKRNKILANDKVMHSFLISRAINVVRYEKLRKMPSTDEIDNFDSSTPTLRIELPEIEFEIDILKEVLFKRLSRDIAEFIIELAFPSPETVQIAIREQNKARKDTALRMNIHKLVILPKHVCVFLKRNKGKAPSPATISRWRRKITEAIQDIWDIK